MIDVALLSCNRARITELAIREIEARTLYPHRLIVLDNGSVDDSPEVVKYLHDEGAIDELILHDENWGVHWGHNRLLEEVESEYYVSTDNDLVPQAPLWPDGTAWEPDPETARSISTMPQDWLQLLVELLDRHGDFAAISCRPQCLIGQPGDLFEGAPPVKELGHVGAHLRLMRADLVRQTGGWADKKEPSRDNEERWICGHLRDDGYRVGYARDVRCLHLFGRPELNEDPWGYDLDLFPEPETHGHRPISPPVDMWQWDNQGFDWQTCRRES